MKYKKIIWCFFSLAGLNTYAQDVDFPAKPKPYEPFFNYLSPDISYPIKKMISIEKDDTLSVKTYNKETKTVHEKPYSKNKPSLADYYFKYNAKKLILEKKYNYTNENVVTKFEYNAAGKCTKWFTTKEWLSKTVVNSAGLTGNKGWEFEYDANGNLLKKYQLDYQNKKTLDTEYIYTDKRQIEAKSPQKSSFYDYNEKGQLTTTSEKFPSPNPLEVTGEYLYNDLSQVSQIETKYYKQSLEYDNGLLSKCIYDYPTKSGSETINFTYKDKLLSKIEINRKGTYTMSLFYISTDYLYGIKNNEYQLVIEFSYDKNSNVTEIKYLVDNAYKFSKRFIYEYY